MPLAGNQHDIAVTRAGDGLLDGFGAVDHCAHVGRAVGGGFARRDAAADLFDDGRGIFAARIVRRDHHDVAQARRHHAHQRTLRAVAIAATPKDGDEAASRERPRRLEQVAQGVVGVGVVDDHRDAIVGRRDHFESAGHPGLARQALGDGLGRNAQGTRRGRGRQQVVHVRAAHQGRAHQHRARRRGGDETDAVERHLELFRTHVGGTLDAVGDRPAARRRQRGGALVVGVDHAGRLRGQHREQSALRREVRLHVDVEVEVVARQVGEDTGRESHAVDTLERQGVRRHLHDARAVAGVEHRPQHRLHVGSFGRGPSRLAGLAADLVVHRAHHAGVPAGGVEDRRQQVGGRGLAVGTGDADDRHLAARVSVNRRAEDGQGRPSVAHRHPRHVHAGGPRLLADDQCRALRERLRHEVQAVGLQSLQRHERGARGHAARVVGDRRHRHVGGVHRHHEIAER